jgi:predicted hydrocarbon binding protein
MEYTLFPSRALTLNLQKTGEKNGKYLFDLGYKTTINFDTELMETLGIRPKAEDKSLEKAKPIFDIMGWGNFEYLKKEYTKSSHHFIVRLSNNPISEYAKQIFGNKSKVCNFMLGMHSAHIKIFFDINVVFKEVKCVTKGDPYCEFVAKR